MTGPDWRYRALAVLATPLLVAHSAWLARQGGDRRLLAERLGLRHSRAPRPDRPVWLHMSSVGEVNAAHPLVDELRARHPDIPLIVSTFTPTGAQTAAKRFGADVEHVYLPLDLGPPVGRFLDRIRPRCALVMETEIWPRLFAECRRRGVPIVIVNGRLSRRTTGRAAWIRRIYARALEDVEQVLARSEEDAARYRGLGMTPERIRVIGNIKLALSVEAASPIALARPYVVAASTHEDEELQLARAWLASDLPHTHLLVIVPRHPRRKEAILARLRPLEAAVAVRSAGEAVNAGTGIYLADTFGELRSFMAGADAVLMGGTLAARGGQNVIEPARLGRAVLFGPHMENFVEERALLLACDAAIEVSDAADMIDRTAKLIADPNAREALGRRAREAIESTGDIAGRYVDALEPWLAR